MVRTRSSIGVVAGAIVLTACGSGYAWDEDMDDSERAEAVDSLLSAVDNRTGEAVGSRAAQVAVTMTDDEVLAAAASICEGLHEGHETQRIIEETAEDVPEFHEVAIGIVGPPAITFLCPDLDPRAP